MDISLKKNLPDYEDAETGSENEDLLENDEPENVADAYKAFVMKEAAGNPIEDIEGKEDAKAEQAILILFDECEGTTVKKSKYEKGDDYPANVRDVCEDLDMIYEESTVFIEQLASVVSSKMGRKGNQSFGDLANSVDQLHSSMFAVRKHLVNGNSENALQVAIILQIASALVNKHSDKLQSTSRIILKRYLAPSDLVSLSDLIGFASRSKSKWRVVGDMRLLRSRIHGVAETLHMVTAGHCYGSDDIILKLASGSLKEESLPYVQIITDLYDPEKARKGLHDFQRTLMVANASMEHMFKKEGFISKSFEVMYRGTMYFCCFRERGVHRGEVSYSGTPEKVMEETLPFAKFMWNLPETALVKKFYKLGLSRVRYSLKFKINDRIPARFVSNNSVGVLPTQFGELPKEKSKPQRAIILHFHGGGFISMSAFSHENYTRQWSISCGVPVISVDYSLAPEHKFPVAVNEAFEAYVWCRQVACDWYGTDKVVLAGDSAGGTLCAAVAIRCIQDGFPKPHGMLLAYPAMDMNRFFTPSILWTLSDRMIPYMFIQCCLSAYLGTRDVDKLLQTCQDPLASPASVDDDVLSQFPRCTFLAATKDPLFDRTIHFADRMHNICGPGSVKLSIVPEMIHGFLSLNWPLVGVPEVNKLIDLCGRYLDELITSEE